MARKKSKPDYNQDDVKKRVKPREPQTTDCGHSLGLLPYLFESNCERSWMNETATDRLSELKRLHKKLFGYKPVGRTEAELEEIIKDRVAKWD